MTLRHFSSVAVVVFCLSVLPAFAQKGGGGGAEGGGGGAGGGGGSTNSSGGSSGGGPSVGGGGGGGSSFGGGGGGSSSGGSSVGGGDFSSFGGDRSNRSGAGGRADRQGGRAANAPAYARSVAPGARTEAPYGSRTRGDHVVTGTAIERETPIHRPGHGDDGFTRYDPYSFYGGVGFSPSALYYSCRDITINVRCYNNYDPWYSGYGYYGLNSMFFDPYWFYGEQSAGGAVAPNPAAGLGTLRLKIKPNKGQVFIDGYLVGSVDEFDGTFQKLKLEQGTHRVEVRLVGYEPLVFDIMIRRGQPTVFEGQLRPRQ
jgi:hypothetical protein